MIKNFFKSILPAPLWSRLYRTRYVLERAARNYRDDLLRLGISSTISLTLSSLGGRRSSDPRPLRLRKIWIKGYTQPLYYRGNTSDAAVIRQVFSKREYECVSYEPNVHVILDCGANIGCTTFHFLHHYPNAHVVVVEPDPGNFAVCQRNLAPFSDRITLVNSGIWSEPAPMKIDRSDGEWAFRVRPTAEGETPEFLSTTIDAILDLVPQGKADIVKVDIEAAEREVFARGSERWLDRTKTVVIEIHGQECEEVFFRALSNYQYDMELSGELTICRNLASAPAKTTLQPEAPSAAAFH